MTGALGSATWGIDVLDESIRIGYLGTGNFIVIPITFALSDLDWVNGPGFIQGVTQQSGPVATEISFGPDSATITVPPVAFPTSGERLLEWTFAIDAVHSPVPEQGSAAGFLAMGLLPAFFAARRRGVRSA